MKFKKRHPVSWFINRTGQEIIKNNQFNLFTCPVKVMSEAHAKALHADQDKGNRYI